MLVGNDADLSHVAVLESGSLVEHYVAQKHRPSRVGNVYLGKVQNVLPGMEAAFVDIGLGRNGVLYVGEVGQQEGEIDVPQLPIEEVLTPGQSVLVQVTKDAMGTKGARLTAHISLAGRYLVIVPKGSGFGISKKLPDAERGRLRDIAKRITPKGYSVIVRTAATGATQDDLARDLDRLVRLDQEIEKRRGAPAPSEVYLEPDLVIRIIRDLFGRDFTELVVEDPQTYQSIREYIAAVDPDLVGQVHLHTGTETLFQSRGVTEQLRKTLERKVWLPSGGYLIIDRTEALTVVDVNSGRYVSGKNLEETVVNVNLEAAREITRQLRLRDIGGIIVIDFIDMLKATNREDILKSLKDYLEEDKTRTHVIGISPLGLVEMTRKNVSEGLLEALGETCPACAGRGIVFG